MIKLLNVFLIIIMVVVLFKLTTFALFDKGFEDMARATAVLNVK